MSTPSLKDRPLARVTVRNIELSHRSNASDFLAADVEFTLRGPEGQIVGPTLTARLGMDVHDNILLKDAGPLLVNRAFELVQRIANEDVETYVQMEGLTRDEKWRAIDPE